MLLLPVASPLLAASPLTRALISPPAPPLTPSPDEARGLLREELTDPAYTDTDWWGRFLDWLGGLLDGAPGASGLDLGPLPTVLTLLVLAVLGVGVGLLASRLRHGARARRDGAGDLLGAGTLSAATLRSRARAALEAGDATTALLDGYRALAVRQVERGHLEDAPGTTAGGVARRLGRVHPEHAGDLLAAAAAFDAALYGHRAPDLTTASAVLDLEHDLDHAPARSSGSDA
ncbi:DUF4129 domain-containing protein [Nocardioides bruguierae]|uniref:DUF4129 domain-containing protein n=1 Tax=Nocardioides bruguierae TaxID=2945102 RepID=A0A9X2IDL8_9ACTN|nr:DUF4129 domain-containing protein [Nocardioides bruguierae]MCM0619896.1 DUF4129 domain-containing protein [Nocardioides bruguierae]